MQISIEQVGDFLAAVDMSGTLDGQPLPDLNGYWGGIEPYEGGTGGQGEDYISQWLYPLGVLSPGTHTVEIRGTLARPVTDGYDMNKDGQLDEYSGEIWRFSLRMEVHERIERRTGSISCARCPRSFCFYPCPSVVAIYPCRRRV
jgi:hypothetical protein